MLYKPTQGIISAGGFRNHPRYRGCVGHWLMNEGGGLKAYDMSGFGRDGTLTNGPTWGSGQFGSALNFDGTDDFVNVPAFYTLADPVSFSAWVYSNAYTSADLQNILSNRTAGNSGVSFVIYDGTGSPPDNFGKLGFIIQGVALYNTTGFVVRSGAWQHVVATFSGTTLNLYVQGVLQETVATGSMTAGDVWNIGTQAPGVTGTDLAFDGLLDDIRIYNRVLKTAAEIASLYNDPFLEFRSVSRRRYFLPAAAATPALMGQALL